MFAWSRKSGMTGSTKRIELARGSNRNRGKFPGGGGVKVCKV